MPSLSDKVWAGDIDAFRGVRLNAKAMMSYDPLGAHALLLSTYISFFGKQSFFGKIKYLVFMLHHALILLRHRTRLDHKQLDILINFLIKIQGVTFFPGVIVALLSRLTTIIEANPEVKPHQKALAYVLEAEVAYVQYFAANPASPKRRAFEHQMRKSLSAALDLEQDIQQETDRLLALRQLVRIYKKTGEICYKIGDSILGAKYLNQALVLAEGEANTQDQAEKIRALIKAQE